jgi:hypothetical protein
MFLEEITVMVSNEVKGMAQHDFITKRKTLASLKTYLCKSQPHTSACPMEEFSWSKETDEE